MKVLGSILIIVGLAMIVFNGINFETQKKVADIGPIKINKTKEHHIGWPTYAGAAVTALGVVVIIVGIKRKKKPA